MRYTIRAKLFTAFAAMLAYTFFIVWVNGNSAAKVQHSILEVVNSVNPEIQSLEKIRSQMLLHLESLAEAGLLVRIEIPSANSAAAEKLLQAGQAKDELISEIEYLKKISGPGRLQQIELIHPIIDEIFSITAKPEFFSGAAEEMLSLKDKVSRIKVSFLNKMDELIEFAAIDIRSSLDSSLVASQAAEKQLHLSGSVIIIIALINALILSYMLTKPVRILNQAVKEIGAGDLSRRVPQAGNDELSELSTAFNEMLGKLESSTVSTDYLSSVLDSMPDGLVVARADGTIERVNRAFCSLMAEEQVAIHGKPIKDLIPLLEAENSKQREAVLQVKDSAIPVSYSVSKLKGSSRNIEQTIILIRDERENIKKQAEMADFKNRATKAEKLAALCTLGGILAHKLNQPLTAIKLFLQQSVNAVKNTDVPDTVVSNLNDSLEAASQAADLVQEVLAFSKRRNEQAKLEISLEQITAETFRALSREAAKAQLKLEKQGLGELPPLKGYPLEIEELFYIIVQNAIQAAAGKKDCRLLVSGKAESGTLIIEIQDNCGGFPKENLNKLFDDFFSTKDPGAGSGFGLHIVRQIVRNHGGLIDIKSSENQGTHFNIKLPLKQMEQ